MPQKLEIDLSVAYQNGRILISNYEDAEVSEKILLQTLSNTGYPCKLNSVRSPLCRKQGSFAIYSIPDSVKQTESGG